MTIGSIGVGSAGTGCGHSLKGDFPAACNDFKTAASVFSHMHSQHLPQWVALGSSTSEADLPAECVRAVAEGFEKMFLAHAQQMAVAKALQVSHATRRQGGKSVNDARRAKRVESNATLDASLLHSPFSSAAPSSRRSNADQSTPIKHAAMKTRCHLRASQAFWTHFPPIDALAQCATSGEKGATSGSKCATSGPNAPRAAQNALQAHNMCMVRLLIRSGPSVCVCGSPLAPSPAWRR